MLREGVLATETGALEDKTYLVLAQFCFICAWGIEHRNGGLKLVRTSALC